MKTMIMTVISLMAVSFTARAGVTTEQAKLEILKAGAPISHRSCQQQIRSNFNGINTLDARSLCRQSVGVANVFINCLRTSRVSHASEALKCAESASLIRQAVGIRPSMEDAYEMRQEDQRAGVGQSYAF